MTVTMEIEMRVQIEAAIMSEMARCRGGMTIEQLMERVGMDWEQVFGAVDRLSRSGAVRLTRVGAEYFIEPVGERA